MSGDQLRRLCQFMTGAPRVPAGQALVFNAWRGGGAGALPRAHSCFNMVDVPCDADSEQQLRRRLAWALEQAEGFAFA